MNMKMNRWLCALVCLCLLIAAQAWVWAEPADVDADIDKIFNKAKVTGGAVLVARHGELVYERYFGITKKRARIPLTATPISTRRRLPNSSAASA